MTTSKISQIVRDIESARCKGQWYAIPELARRYKKYCSSGTVLEQTILVEATLAQYIENYEDDDGNQVRVESHQVEPLLQQLESALESANDLTTDAEKEFCRVVVARCYYECGELSKALDIVEALSFKKDDVASGYGLILFLQARAIKAIGYEKAGNMDAAMQSFLGILDLLKNASEASSNDLVFIEWTEEALYRAVLAALGNRSLVQQQHTMDFIRTYHNVTVGQPIGWRTIKRMNIIRHSTKYLSSLFTAGQYIDTNGQLPGSQQAFTSEIMSLYTLYERMLLSEAYFPKAGDTNWLVIDFINQLAADIEILDTLTPQHLRGFMEVLERAAQRTFNSPCITRHMFYTLMRLCDYEEAKHALHSYLHQVGLSTKEWQDARSAGDAFVTNPLTGKSQPIPHVEGHALDHLVQRTVSGKRVSIASQRVDEKESLSDMIHVFLEAVKLYCVHVGDGPGAVEMAEMARKKLVADVVPTAEGPKLEAQVYRATGIAYSCLARQTSDSSLRATYYEKALEAFCESADMDPHSWKTYYHLALQYAEMRDTQNALQAVTRALQQNSNEISLWHLLTLVCSCPGQNDLTRALKTCELGLQQQTPEDDQPDVLEQRLLLQMTQSLLFEKLYGPQAALEAQEGLFAAYGKMEQSAADNQHALLYQNKNLIVSGSLNNLGQSETQLSQQRRRGLSVSSQQVPQVEELQISASRSTDDVHTSRQRRSPSTFSNGNSNTFLTVPDEDTHSIPESVRTNSSHRSYGLHLFSSRSTTRRSKRDLTVNEAPCNFPGDLSLEGLSPHGSTSQSSMSSLLKPAVPVNGQQRHLSTRLRQQHFARILSDLWLLSASSFLKLGKLGEALKAIEEAENADRTSNARVWAMLGRYWLAQKNIDNAIEAFEKGAGIDPQDIDNSLCLANAYFEIGNMEMAEGTLESLTKGFGWHSAAAWFHLGRIHQCLHRSDRAKECMMYALDLENTQPIQPFSILPVYI